MDEPYREKKVKKEYMHYQEVQGVQRGKRSVCILKAVSHQLRVKNKVSRSLDK